jgi:NAD/NADP transhydrogenase alpha subunit
LQAVAGVKSTSVNVLTGSLVIQFDLDTVRSESILSLLANENYIDLGRAVTSQQYVERALSNAGKTVSKALLGLALDKAFEGSSLSIIAAFI